MFWLLSGKKMECGVAVALRGSSPAMLDGEHTDSILLEPGAARAGVPSGPPCLVITN